MKISRLIVIILLLITIIMFSVFLLYTNKKKEALSLKTYNMEYELYLNNEIDGVDLATLINKTINQNEKNNIEKDQKKHYIENDTDSIKIEIKILLTDKTYSMEEFYNNDTSEFVKYFQDERFICNNIEYHEKTGKVKKMFFNQI